ncbi:MAG: aminotransferase class IV [Flavobacteriaceae bacterium]|nr:aminotransferase class IV [Flavobacteriaceae bacterium]
MINLNGQLISENSPVLNYDNRSFKYGDGVFDTLKVLNGKVIFLEDHYFRMMASMRMLRMEIPMEFTLEFMENEILNLIQQNNLNDARVRLTVFRKDGGKYAPKTNKIEFVIEADLLQTISRESYEVELFKDFYSCSGLFSTIKTTSRTLNVIASVFAEENEYANCIFLNEKKQVVEAINGNIFIVNGNKITTPTLENGCIKGIIRQKIIDLIKKHPSFEIEEREISPFELNKADEVFITNSIVDIQAVTKYRKKTYKKEVSSEIANLLKEMYL